MWLNAIHIVNFIIVNDVVELLNFIYMKVIYYLLIHSAVRHKRSNMHHYNTNESVMIKRGCGLWHYGDHNDGVKSGCGFVYMSWIKLNLKLPISIYSIRTQKHPLSQSPHKSACAPVLIASIPLMMSSMTSAFPYCVITACVE